MMDLTFRECLEDLADRLDEDQERANCEAWRQFLFDEWPHDVFTPPPRQPAPPGAAWPDVTPRQAATDVQGRMLRRLAVCSETLTVGSGGRLGVCCAGGDGLLASLFGCKLDPKRLTPRPVRSLQVLADLPAAGVPDVRSGLCARLFETAVAFSETFDRYHAVGQHVTLHYPQLPNPLTLLTQLAGTRRLATVRQDTRLLNDLLALVTETIAAFLRQWYRLMPHRSETAVYDSIAYKGRILLRLTLPPAVDAAFYAKHVAALDQSLLDLFGGGAFVLVGRAVTLIEPLSELHGLTGVLPDNWPPAMMETIYRHTVDKRIKILALDRRLAAGANRPLKGQVHCP